VGGGADDGLDAQVGSEVSGVEATAVSLRIRDYIEPLVVINTVQVCGGGDGGSQGREDEADDQQGKKMGQLPSDWRWRGCVIMSEERLPEAASCLNVPVLQRVHPEAPAVLLTKSPAPTKLWAELDIVLHDVRLSHGPRSCKARAQECPLRVWTLLTPPSHRHVACPVLAQP